MSYKADLIMFNINVLKVCLIILTEKKYKIYKKYILICSFPVNKIAI